MKLFDFKKQKTVNWTEKTAPKERLILAKISVELEAQDVTTSYPGPQRIMLESLQTSLLSKTDAEKEAIKIEIAEKFNNLYDQVCAVIDADTNIFTEGFWQSVNETKDKEVI